MATVLLIRHGRTAANASGVLAGRTPGVSLDDAGVRQAEDLGRRLAALPLAGIVASPLQRTQETADAILSARTSKIPRLIDEDLAECDYGQWTGQSLKELSRDPLWKAVQGHPSSVTFPGGESMLAMQLRAVAAVRRWNEHFSGVYAIVSHGDVIKAILADALGMHLDQFQRIHVDPCSLSVVDYTPLRPFVVRMNDVGGDLAAFEPRRRSKRRSSDAAIGGGSGGQG